MGYDAWSTLNLCLPSWVEVTRIQLINDGTRRGYTLLPNIVGATYSKYFKNGLGISGMWTVINDGFGNLQISVNNLSSTSGNTDIDTTLKNVSDLIYYHSKFIGRITASNIEAPINPGTFTHIFVGFNANGSVATNVALIPSSLITPSTGGAGGGSSGGWLDQNVFNPIAKFFGW
jgi:hypothetical protein